MPCQLTEVGSLNPDALFSLDGAAVTVSGRGARGGRWATLRQLGDATHATSGCGGAARVSETLCVGTDAASAARTPAARRRLEMMTGPGGQALGTRVEVLAVPARHPVGVTTTAVVGAHRGVERDARGGQSVATVKAMAGRAAVPPAHHAEGTARHAAT